MFRGPTKYSEYIQDVPKSIDYILKRVNAVTVADLQAVTNAGATTTLPINTGGITSDYFQLDTTATPTLVPGMFGWNDAYGTADLRLKGNNVTLQLGQETLARVVNKTGSDLLESEYKVVRVRIASEGGAQGQRLAVVLAQGLNDPESATTLGIVTEDIANNQEGFITVFGNVNNINTTGSLQGETWVDGDVLYLSPTTAGGLTNIKPQAPQHTVVMGYVVYAHNNQGKIFVKVDNGYELDELHNVRITSVANNDLLQYDSTLQVWKNVAASVAVPTPTLAQVTTAGNTTTNGIVLGSATVITASPYTLQVVGGAGGSAIFSNAAKTQGLNINLTTAGETRIYGDYFGAGVDQKLILGTFANRATQLVLQTSGNVGIGTTTDAGFKLDVNGTSRVQSGLANNSSSTAFQVTGASGSLLRLRGYGDLYIEGSTPTIFVGGQGTFISGGSANFYSNQAAGNVFFSVIHNNSNVAIRALSNSNVLLNPTAGNVGIGTTTPAAKLQVSGSVTASSALAQGVFFNNTLVAAANNDVLVGLDINPTFTLGGFTGTQRYGLRIQNSPVLITGTYNSLSSEGINPDSLININATIVGRGGSRAIAMRLAPTINVNSVGSQTFAALEINPTYQNVGVGSNAYSLNSIGTNYVGPINVFGWHTTWQQQGGTSTYHVIGAPNGQGFRVQVNSNIAGYSFEFDGSGIPTYTLRNNNIDAVKVYNTGNVGIATTTDAGYKLDVNGTARVVGPTFRVGDASKYFEVYTDGSGYRQLRFFSAGNFETTLVSTSGGGLAGYNSGVFSWSFLASKLQILTVSSEGFSGYQPLNFNSNLYPANTTTAAYAFNVYTNSGSGITVKRLQMFNGDTGKVILQETGGNVLIGTATDAGYKLDVNGTGRFSGQVKFDNSNIIATGITSQVANFQIARANTNTSVEIIGGATSVKFDATSASASTQFAGKVAIGSAYFTPTEMLHVDGSIKSSALTLNGPVLATGGVLSSIAGYTGLFTVPTNPPGMQTLDIQNGIIVNVL